ncbi:MAG: C25 family cysteine peptidase [Blastocatellia bacterium]
MLRRLTALSFFLGVCLFLPGEALGQFQVGSFAKSTAAATATQTVSHSLGVTPRAIIFWTTGQTANGSFGASFLYGMGFTDGTGSRAVAAASQDNQGTSNTSRRIASKAITIVQWGETLLAEADLQSWNTTGFTLSWTTNNNQAYIINFLAIGGSDVRAKVVDWVMGTATGNRSVTGVGFIPDLVFHAHAGSGFTGAIGTSAQHAGFGIGVMNANSEQWSNELLSADNLGTSDTQRAQRSDACLTTINNTPAHTKIASYASMDTDGFTVNFTTANTTAGRVISLALQCVSSTPGAFNKSTGAATATQAVTGVGFRPQAVFFSSFQDVVAANPITNTRLGVGASDGTNERSIALTDGDNLGTTEVDSINKNNKVFILNNNNSPGAVQAEADLNSMDADGFTLGWTTNNAVATEIHYVAMAPCSVTRVEDVEFTASRTPEGTLLEWRTGAEAENLGFRVYREVNGQKVALHSSLIAGSALLTGPGGNLPAGRPYQLLDPATNSGTDAGAQYWLEDVDIRGRHEWHGPVTPKPGGATREFQAEFPTHTLRDLGHMPSQMESASGIPRVAWSLPGALARADLQWKLASGAALKIPVGGAGWYRLEQADLLAAGIDPRVDPRLLRLYSLGQELPLSVSGQNDGRFDPGDTVEFYGEGIETPFTSQRMYWLVQGDGPGLRIPPANRAGRPFPPARGRAPQGANAAMAAANTDSYRHTVRLTDRVIYFAALKNGPASNIFGPVLSASMVTRAMTLSQIAPGDTRDAELEVSAQGVTIAQATGASPNHCLRVSLNGQEAGEMRFDGQQLAPARFAIPHAQLREGANAISLTACGGEDDISLLAELRLSYQRRLVADNGALRFTAGGGETVRVEGFGETAIRVFDVSDAARITELNAPPGTSGAAISVSLPGNGPRTLYAVAAARITRPASDINVPSRLHDTGNEAEILMIAPRYFLDTLKPLAAFRRAQGYKTMLVAVEDIYDEFSFGMKDPAAIRLFLRRARDAWAGPPRFALLAGDASYDPRNDLGYGASDLIPAMMVETSGLEAASDGHLADFDDDDAPEMAVGRLPARTAAELERMVAAILRYEQSPGMGSNEVLLVTGEDEIVDFAAKGGQVIAAAQALIAPERTRVISTREATARADVLRELSRGPLLASFLGHGTYDTWDKRKILTARDTGAFNQQAPPLILAMTCLNGSFVSAEVETLAEAMLRSGAAIGVLASAGVSNALGQEILLRETLRALLGSPSLTIGEAVARAKAETPGRDLRRLWNLLGDPVVRLRKP